VPLAYYSHAATQEFWSEHWQGEDVRGLVEVARISPLTSIIEAALPPAGRVLEAGCGLGPYVILLRERGRAIAGADWSLDALRRCRAAAPAAPVAAMDLRSLAVRSGALAAYVSLGVVEHDPAGPDAIVAEAARVLAPGGRLLLSVPYWNGVRALCAPHLRREGRRVRAAGGEFYQFAFRRREVRAFLEAHGFRVLAFHPYDPARMPRKLLKRLIPGRRPGEGRAAAGPGRAVPAGSALRRGLKRLLYSEASLRLFAHMILAVAIRK
jgi:SAM-dependent methyltransferase